jgi:hypothetical protein
MVAVAKDVRVEPQREVVDVHIPPSAVVALLLAQETLPVLDAV